MMENRNHLVMLFDIYGDLLTKVQQDSFKFYYFDNLSLAETGENLEVSRNAIHKNIKLAEKNLIMYEEKLKLYEKTNKLNIIIDSLDNNSDIKNKLIDINK